MLNKPFAAAAEQNRNDILYVLKQTFKDIRTVLEIGSGTGQHAAYFSQHLRHLTWQASDKAPMLSGISMWLDELSNTNVPAPIALDVTHDWPTQKYQGAFAANIAHIMHWNELEALFSGLNQTLASPGIFCLYGPFNIDQQYTSESNRRFDQWLKQRDTKSGIRDKNDLDLLAMNNNFDSAKIWDMPTNNKILCWVRPDS